MALFGLVTSGLAAGAAAGALLLGTGSALADPSGPDPAPPNCTAADLARVSAEVAAATSGYLFAHPDTNDFFTGLKGQRGTADFRQQVQDYMDANPQVHADLRAIRQPLTDLQNRCELTADPLVN